MRREQDERHVADELAGGDREEPEPNCLLRCVRTEQGRERGVNAFSDPGLRDPVRDHEQPREEQQQGPIDLREHRLGRLPGEGEQQRGAGHRRPGEIVAEQEPGEDEGETAGAEQRQRLVEGRRSVQVHREALPRQLAAERDQKHAEDGAQGKEGRQQQRLAELCVRNAAQRADQHVLRVAGERRD